MLNIHLFAGSAFFAVLWDGWVDLRSSALSAVFPDERIRVHLCVLWAVLSGMAALRLGVFFVMSWCLGVLVVLLRGPADLGLSG